MNIKLISENERWYVVVNSVAGEFRQDVTGQIVALLNSAVHKEAATKLLALYSQEVKAAADECLEKVEQLRDMITGG